MSLHGMDPSEKNILGTQPPLSKWSSLSLSLQSHLATLMENKRVFFSSILTIFIIIIIAFIWMERSAKKSAQKIFEAQELVSHLRDPFMGEKEATLPPYKDIVSTLTKSQQIRNRFNGVLLEETIIADQKDVQKFQIQNPFPEFPWPWKEFVSIQEKLETNEYTDAYRSIEALLQDIQKRGGEKLLNELVGYLILMKEKCLKTLHLPSATVHVQFSTWKKTYPESAAKLALSVPEKELL